jgi:hypothetical protein
MNLQRPTPNREAEIWARLMRAQKDELPTEAAEFLLGGNGQGIETEYVRRYEKFQSMTQAAGWKNGLGVSLAGDGVEEIEGLDCRGCPLKSMRAKSAAGCEFTGQRRPSQNFPNRSG